MATNTYVPVETYTIGSDTTTVTFGAGNTLPQTYTDLVIVINTAANYTDNGARGYIQFNGDTGNNYADVWFGGDGSSPATNKDTPQSSIAYGVVGNATSPFTTQIINVNNYANDNTVKTTLSRSSNPNAAGNYGLRLTFGYWNNTAPITTIALKCDGNYRAGSTFTLYGISNAGDDSPKANGGDVYSDSTYWYHAFTMSGNFVPNQAITADVLCIGGGGGGGNGRAGGGGAGGYLYSTSQSMTTTPYTIIVGGGGFATTTNGTSGNDSNVIGSGFSTLTAGGGGYGGDTGSAGGSGGSGGGGGGANTGGGSVTGLGVGYTGGGGVYNPSYGRAGGGGGGAGGGGGTGSSPGSGGNGGLGIQNTTFASATLTGVSGYYAGGGGGGSAIAGAVVATGGSGTGGNGGTDSPATIVQSTAGVANTGGGGGGGGGTGSNGGSGLVIIRYPKA